MAKVKIRGLDCSAPADKMIPLVLRAQVRAMCRHRDHALNWRDPEGVHDMRVLSRRLRSAINDFRPYFRKAALPRTKLRTLAGKLGDVRDEDVALMALKELAAQAKGKAADGIRLIAAQRKQQRTKSRAALKQTFADPAVAEFQKDFLAKLRTMSFVAPGAKVSQQTVGGFSFREVGAQIIAQRVKDFITASRCLYEPYKVKQHHELRILAKRLRYSMELFAVCWRDEFPKRAKEVAHMQTSLGELHDCDVWISDLGAWLKRAARRKALEPDEIKMRTGATWLLEHFTQERMEHYREALTRWEQWQADGFLEDLTPLLEPKSATDDVEVAARPEDAAAATSL